MLGGGAAGLAAAWRLSKNGRDVHVIEMSSRLGGLAGGVELNGNIYEFGPHMFHTTDEEILSDIVNLMGTDLIAYEKTQKVKFMGEYFDFPLLITDVLFKLPLRTVIQGAASFFYHNLRSSFVKPNIETSETILVGNYGSVLYEIFFKSYIERVWGVPPSEFSPNFARQRIPKMNLLEVIEKLTSVFKTKPKEVDVEQFVEKEEGKPFTTRRGFSMITERIGNEIKKHGGKITLNMRAKEILVSENRVHSLRVAAGDIEEVIDCDHVISTVPVNTLLRLVNPPPPQAVFDAGNNLKFRPTLFVGIVVQRKPILPASFMYFREASFNRIMDLSFFGMDIRPEHATILIAEVNCETTDFIWIEENHAKEMVIKDLVEEQLLRQDEILECHVFKAPHAYPMYLLGYEEQMKTIKDWIDGIDNLQTIGRQGLFQYINSHIAMKMGYIAADKIIHPQSDK